MLLAASAGNKKGCLSILCLTGRNGSGGDKAGRVGEGGLAALYVMQGLTHHLLGQAGTFAALGADAEAVAHVANL